MLRCRLGELNKLPVDRLAVMRRHRVTNRDRRSGAGRVQRLPDTTLGALLTRTCNSAYGHVGTILQLGAAALSGATTNAYKMKLWSHCACELLQTLVFLILWRFTAK